MMSIMVIWLMMVAMSSEFIIGFIAGFIVVFVITILVYKLWQARKRSKYNLEYPADFVERSSADEDMRYRFRGRHFK